MSKTRPFLPFKYSSFNQPTRIKLKPVVCCILRGNVTANPLKGDYKPNDVVAFKHYCLFKRVKEVKVHIRLSNFPLTLFLLLG